MSGVFRHLIPVPICFLGLWSYSLRQRRLLVKPEVFLTLHDFNRLQTELPVQSAVSGAATISSTRCFASQVRIRVSLWPKGLGRLLLRQPGRLITPTNTTFPLSPVLTRLTPHGPDAPLSLEWSTHKQYPHLSSPVVSCRVETPPPVLFVDDTPVRGGPRDPHSEYLVTVCESHLRVRHYLLGSTPEVGPDGTCDSGLSRRTLGTSQSGPHLPPGRSRSAESWADGHQVCHGQRNPLTQEGRHTDTDRTTLTGTPFRPDSRGEPTAAEGATTSRLAGFLSSATTTK